MRGWGRAEGGERGEGRVGERVRAEGGERGEGGVGERVG